jgi:superfamily II DNA helicase RecQ
VVFCNSRKQSLKFWNNLERKLNEMKLNVDVIHINGSLHKTNKYWQICLYCNEGHIREADYHVLVTTNAANVGIDKSSIALQVRFKWPRDLLTYFQEQGRGSRQRGMKSICVLYSDVPSYVSLVYQLLCGDDNTTGDIAEAEGSGECEGFDSAILPQCQVRRANTSQHDFALGPAAKKNLRARLLAELNEVMRFFCLNYGCLHK